MNNELANAHVPPPGGLSEGQRLNRICELLSKAVVGDWASRIVGARDPRGAQVEPRPLSETSDEARILSYLALIGEAGAPLIRETLGLSKMRVYRAIQPLVRCGRVAVKGHNRMTTYALSQIEASKVGLN